MPFAPTLTHDSKVQPGVKFTVHRMGFGRRTDLDFATLAFRQRLRELESDHPPRSDQEKELGEQLAIAQRKAFAVPADQYDAVLKADVEPLAAELAACVPADVKKRRTVLNEEYTQVEARIQAAWVRAGLVSIDGDPLDGMTAEQLLDYGPQELALEIYGALIGDGRLGETGRGNSLSPGTSSGQADGASRNTTATPAESQPTPITSGATASSISPGT